MLNENRLFEYNNNQCSNPNKNWIDELVINLHITEACNYSCGFCYAHWAKRNRPEFWKSPHDVMQLLDALKQYFTNPNTNFRQKLDYKHVRLSFAGGEPTLIPQLGDYITYAAKIGFRISLITNGSRLNEGWLQQYGADIAMLGLSIDSINPATQHAIGRKERKDGTILSLNDFKHIADYYKKVNSAGKLKINSVISEHNYHENMSALITAMSPDKWKILKVMPFQGYDVLAQSKFSEFIFRHHAFKSIISPESNDDMTDSYLMINPDGRFYQNSQLCDGNEHDESAPILETGVEQALAQINFNPIKFINRY